MPVDVVATHSTETGGQMVAAIFNHRQQAEVSLSLLQQAGFDMRSISFLQRKGEVLAELEPQTQAGQVIQEDEQPLAENPALGAISGGLIGGAAGWLVGLGLIAIPGLGPFLAAGTLATLAASAAVGAVAGGLGGALLLWGVPDDVAHHYAAQLEAGRCMIIVDTEGPEPQNLAADILERAGGQDVRTFVREVR